MIGERRRQQCFRPGVTETRFDRWTRIHAGGHRDVPNGHRPHQATESGSSACPQPRDRVDRRVETRASRWRQRVAKVAGTVVGQRKPIWPGAMDITGHHVRRADPQDTERSRIALRTHPRERFVPVLGWLVPAAADRVTDERECRDHETSGSQHRYHLGPTQSLAANLAQECRHPDTGQHRHRQGGGHQDPVDRGAWRTHPRWKGGEAPRDQRHSPQPCGPDPAIARRNESDHHADGNKRPGPDAPTVRSGEESQKVAEGPGGFEHNSQRTGAIATAQERQRPWEQDQERKASHQGGAAHRESDAGHRVAGPRCDDHDSEQHHEGKRNREWPPCGGHGHPQAAEHCNATPRPPIGQPTIQLRHGQQDKWRSRVEHQRTNPASLNRVSRQRHDAVHGRRHCSRPARAGDAPA